LVALAAAKQTATVNAATSGTYGTYLTDAQGNSLYMFTKDTKSTSTCTGKCAKVWPPLTVTGKPTAGKGVAGSLLGTIKRSDGSMQVTYNGIPLYTYSKDQKPGDTNGEGVGKMWYLVSPYAEAIKPPAKKAPQSSGGAASGGKAAVGAMKMAQLMGTGKQVFSNNCAVCHGAQGQGGRGIKLAGFSGLSSTSAVVHQILRGSEFMPSFADQLSNKQIAAVATYIRNSWGNSFGPVSVKEVGQRR
jgi:predicted lipoprotein with Yx(FWY)xxD motif